MRTDIIAWHICKFHVSQSPTIFTHVLGQINSILVSIIGALANYIPLEPACLIICMLGLFFMSFLLYLKITKKNDVSKESFRTNISGSS